MSSAVRAFLACALAASACGRVGFASQPDGVGGGDATTDPCAGGDGICLASCVGVDPDCMTTCGDGRCVGNAGEMCNTCPADCATETPVCGNGACDPGEATTCFADCGPVPWTWTADEQAFLDAVNMARTGGTMCPGAGSVTTAPALTLDAALTPPAHEWAWEIGHDNFYLADAAACNGRTFAQRSAAGGYVTALSAYQWATAADAENFFATDMASCPTLMDTARTQVGVGVALDGQRGFVLVFK